MPLHTTSPRILKQAHMLNTLHKIPDPGKAKPEGFDAGLSIALAAQEAAEHGDLPDDFTNGRWLNRRFFLCQNVRPLPRCLVCPCPWNPSPIAESRIGLLGLSRMPVLLEPRRADVRQRGVQPGAVVPEYPGDDLVLGLAPRHEALPMQSLHLQRTEQGLAAGVVPAVALAAHRGRDAALGEHV